VRRPEPRALLDIDLLDDDAPFEIDDQAPHLFKHQLLDIDDLYEVWESDAIFYPARPPADWLMVADVAGRVLVVPIAKPRSGEFSACRPIGCYEAPQQLTAQYRADRRAQREL
jgi:hypothetical protein